MMNQNQIIEQDLTITSACRTGERQFDLLKAKGRCSYKLDYGREIWCRPQAIKVTAS